MQLRLQTELTFERYVSEKGWKRASLAACPFHPAGGCGFASHGTYMRKVPAVAWVARWYCPTARVTIGLLPDFFASRMPGTLDEIEETAARAEATGSAEKTAEELRPGDVADAVTLPAALRWVRLRVQLVAMTLVTIAGLFPDRFAGAATIGQLRRKLGTTSALVALREIAERHLHALPKPLGWVPRPTGGPVRGGPFQQSTGLGRWPKPG